jgi:hypothetical protein
MRTQPLPLLELSDNWGCLVNHVRVRRFIYTTRHYTESLYSITWCTILIRCPHFIVLVEVKRVQDHKLMKP